jgi:hypothetical protein
VLTDAVGPGDRELHDVLGTLGALFANHAAEFQGIAGEIRDAEANRHGANPCARAGTVIDEALHVTIGGQNVHDDVRRTAPRAPGTSW